LCNLALILTKDKSLATLLLNFCTLSFILLNKVYTLHILYTLFNFYNKIEKVFYNRIIHVEERNNTINNKNYRIIKERAKVIERKANTKREVEKYKIEYYNNIV